MKGRGKTARMAAVAAPRSTVSGGASAAAGEDADKETALATTTSASAVDPAPVATEQEEGVATAFEDEAVTVDGSADNVQAPADVVARAEDLDMDETEYTDEVDNEFVRGRMQNVVRVATGNDIEVKFGEGCHTDLCGEVQIDPNDPSKNASAEDRIVMMQGGLEHEITHELYYDKSAFESMKSRIEADPLKRPLAFISNILVDGHDEWRHKLARPEAYGIIEAHDELMVRHNGSGRWSFDPENQDTWTQVTGAMLYRGLPYYRVPEDKLSDEAREAYHECSPNVDAAIKGTSHDCIKHSEEIFEKLKARGLIPENPNQDHLGGGAGPGAEGAPGMGGAAGGSSGSSSGGASSDSSASSGDGSQETGSGSQGAEDGELSAEDARAYDEAVSGSSGSGTSAVESGDEGSGGGSSSSSGEGSEDGAVQGSGSGSRGSREDRAAAGGSGGDGGGGGGEPGNEDGSARSGSPDSGATGSEFAANPGASDEELESRRRQAKSLANTAASKKPRSSHRSNPEEQVPRPPNALSEFRGRWQKNRRLARDFASQIKQAQTETTAPKRKQTSGRLDRGRRRALAAGDEKVFVKRGRAREVDMSVELLLDTSGSMRDSMDGLKDSTSVISRGLDEAKIEHEVRGFSDWDEQPLYRAFGETADWKLGAMQSGGGTLMGTGIEKLRGGFAGRSDKQKLGLVLADGMPSDESSVREQLAQARREGITPFGIFLRPGPESMKHPDHKEMAEEGEAKMRELFSGNVAVLDDVGQLPKVAGKKIVELMRRQS